MPMLSTNKYIIAFKVLLIFACFITYSCIFCSNAAFAENKHKPKYSFKRMPNFKIPRSGGATATVLKDGRVLFTGGIFSPLNSTNSAEIYDPVKKVFIKLPNMNESRTLHSAVLLSNGDVLISGGEKHERGKGFDFLKSAEIYKTKENKFVKINDMQEVMSLHKMYTLPNNNIVALKNPNEIQIFDIKTNTFKKMQGMPYDSTGSSYEFLELNDDEILMYPFHYEKGKNPIVVFNKKDLSLNKLDINPFQNIKYNTNLSQYTINQLKNERSGYAVAKVSGSEIFVSGGEGGYLNGCWTTIKVNIDTKEETVTPFLPYKHRRYNFSAISLDDGNVLLLGGESGSDFSLKTLKTTLLYINSENKLLKFKNMKRSRAFASFVKLNNGNYIIWGGCNAFGHLYPPEMLVVKRKLKK